MTDTIMIQSHAFNRLAACAAILLMVASADLGAFTVTKSQDLSFGKFAPAGGSGTVSMLATGGRQASGVFLITKGVGADGNPADFSVAGGASYAICTFEVTPASFSLSGPGSGMGVGSIVVAPVSGTIQLNVSGGGTIFVGATLAVGGGQVAGSYANNSVLSVTVTCP